MQDDQQISQSVDNVIAGTPDDQSDHTDSPPASQSPFSLGSNPSSSGSADDSASPLPPPAMPPADDGLVTVDQTSDSNDLNDIKQQALSQLTPIISDLDQTPEEKYRTLMMLIQASDDKSLIKNAFEAANSIEDKKAKAEALLNIVNEINYFSSAKSADEETGIQEDL